MDIYRFFHPHHNPRLYHTRLRQQELSELEQAASELRKALERAASRVARRAVAPIMPQHFEDLLKAARFLERSLQTICDAHPGDELTDLKDLLSERADMVGWEPWANLLYEQLQSVPEVQQNEDALEFDQQADRFISGDKRIKNENTQLDSSSIEDNFLDLDKNSIRKVG